MREFAADIVETSPDPTASLDGDLKVVAANRAFCELFKASGDRCQGLGILDVAAAHIDREKFKAFLEKNIPRRGKAAEGLVSFRGGGGARKLTVSLRNTEVADKRLPSFVMRMKVEEQKRRLRSNVRH
jgi:PAS domain S-box-containing protein